MIEPIRVKHRPKLLSDNGSVFIFYDLRDYIKDHELSHVHDSIYYPRTQGKIERWHHSMKNIVKLVNYYFPWDFKQAISAFVDYYNHEHYHESLENLTRQMCTSVGMRQGKPEERRLNSEPYETGAGGKFACPPVYCRLMGNLITFASIPSKSFEDIQRGTKCFHKLLQMFITNSFLYFPN